MIEHLWLLAFIFGPIFVLIEILAWLERKQRKAYLNDGVGMQQEDSAQKLISIGRKALPKAVFEMLRLKERSDNFEFDQHAHKRPTDMSQYHWMAAHAARETAHIDSSRVPSASSPPVLNAVQAKLYGALGSAARLTAETRASIGDVVHSMVESEASSPEPHGGGTLAEEASSPKPHKRRWSPRFSRPTKPKMPRWCVRPPSAAPSAGNGLDIAILPETLKQRRGRSFTRLELRKLGFTIGKADVLKDLNAQMLNGELVALMGESGSGKSTLLNMICGQDDYGKRSGQVILNGRPFNPHTMRHMLGFVPQAYLISFELTVYENLMYAAWLRLPTSVTQHEREETVTMTLHMLGLRESSHFLCNPHGSGGERLSGGQLRRVGIGIELVRYKPMYKPDPYLTHSRPTPRRAGPAPPTPSHPHLHLDADPKLNLKRQQPCARRWRTLPSCFSTSPRLPWTPSTLV